MSRVRNRIAAETGARGSAVRAGMMVVLADTSRNLWPTDAAFVLAGAGWTLLVAPFNVALQLSAPRRVKARALAWFSSAITGGEAVGA